MTRILTLLALAIYISNANGQQFVIQDTRVGDPTTSYLDFEFWQQGNRFCFQDENNSSYVGLVDSVTGDLLTASGKDYLFDNTLTLITQSINGPEWGYR